MYIVHKDYATYQKFKLHLVRCPDGKGKLFSSYEDVLSFLKGKTWRLAN